MNFMSLNLTLEQQFEFRRMQSEFEELDREQAIDFLLQTAQQLMIRDNLIRDLMKRAVI